MVVLSAIQFFSDAMIGRGRNISLSFFRGNLQVKRLKSIMTDASSLLNKTSRNYQPINCLSHNLSLLVTGFDT